MKIKNSIVNKMISPTPSTRSMKHIPIASNKLRKNAHLGSHLKRSCSMIRRTRLRFRERLVQLFKKYERTFVFVFDSHAIHFRIMSGRSVKVHFVPDANNSSASVFVIGFS